jgi:hypothetical protein
MKNARGRWLVLIGMFVGSLLASEAQAEPFWKKLPLVRRIEADPNKSYALTEKQGPWLILATTFAGDEAQQQAHELVIELRKRHHLNAYTHRMHFDFTKQAKARGVDRYGEPIKVQYRVNAMDEVAVLVGDFESVDDDAAQKTLKMLKYDCDPQCMKTGAAAEDNRLIADFRDMLKNARTVGGYKNVKKRMGPLANAHLTTNPLVPDEYYAPKGLDKFVVEMNRPVEHSLLDCPGRYTVKIATFSGSVIIDQKKIREVEKGARVGSQLAEAAEKAHRVTMTLREQGYEAYEFHDRGQSIVTVGNFNSVGTPRADGKIEINPKIHALMTTFGAEKQASPGQINPRVGLPKVIDDIPLDIQPMIVEVPRKSVSSDYAETAMWR